MENIFKMKLRTTKTNRLQQLDGRKFKEKLHQVTIDKLSELDVDITEVQNGFVIEIPHEELGSIPVEVKMVVKPIDYDVMTAGEEYQQKLQAQKEKDKAKA